jgi:hypothetical protein
MAVNQNYEKAGQLLHFLTDVSENNPSLRVILNNLSREGINSANDLFLVQPEHWEEIQAELYRMDEPNVGKNTLIMQFKDLFYDFSLEEYNNEHHAQTNVLPRNDTYYWLFPSSLLSPEDSPPQSGGKKNSKKTKKTKKTKKRVSRKKNSKKTKKRCK